MSKKKYKSLAKVITLGLVLSAGMSYGTGVSAAPTPLTDVVIYTDVSTGNKMIQEYGQTPTVYANQFVGPFGKSMYTHALVSEQTSFNLGNSEASTYVAGIKLNGGLTKEFSVNLTNIELAEKGIFAEDYRDGGFNVTLSKVRTVTAPETPGSLPEGIVAVDGVHSLTTTDSALKTNAKYAVHNIQEDASFSRTVVANEGGSAVDTVGGDFSADFSTITGQKGAAVANVKGALTMDHVFANSAGSLFGGAIDCATIYMVGKDVNISKSVLTSALGSNLKDIGFVGYEGGDLVASDTEVTFGWGPWARTFDPGVNVNITGSTLTSKDVAVDTVRGNMTIEGSSVTSQEGVATKIAGNLKVKDVTATVTTTDGDGTNGVFSYIGFDENGDPTAKPAKLTLENVTLKGISDSEFINTNIINKVNGSVDVIDTNLKAAGDNHSAVSNIAKDLTVKAVEKDVAVWSNNSTAVDGVGGNAKFIGNATHDVNIIGGNGSGKSGSAVANVGGNLTMDYVIATANGKEDAFGYATVYGVEGKVTATHSTLTSGEGYVFDTVGKFNAGGTPKNLNPMEKWNSGIFVADSTVAGAEGLVNRVNGDVTFINVGTDYIIDGLSAANDVFANITGNLTYIITDDFVEGPTNRAFMSSENSVVNGVGGDVTFKGYGEKYVGLMSNLPHAECGPVITNVGGKVTLDRVDAVANTSETGDHYVIDTVGKDVKITNSYLASKDAGIIKNVGYVQGEDGLEDSDTKVTFGWGPWAQTVDVGANVTIEDSELSGGADGKFAADVISNVRGNVTVVNTKIGNVIGDGASVVNGVTGDVTFKVTDPSFITYSKDMVLAAYKEAVIRNVDGVVTIAGRPESVEGADDVYKIQVAAGEIDGDTGTIVAGAHVIENVGGVNLSNATLVAADKDGSVDAVIYNVGYEKDATTGNWVKSEKPGNVTIDLNTVDLRVMGYEVYDSAYNSTDDLNQDGKLGDGVSEGALVEKVNAKWVDGDGGKVNASVNLIGLKNEMLQNKMGAEDGTDGIKGGAALFSNRFGEIQGHLALIDSEDMGYSLEGGQGYFGKDEKGVSLILDGTNLTGTSGKDAISNAEGTVVLTNGSEVTSDYRGIAKVGGVVVEKGAKLNANNNYIAIWKVTDDVVVDKGGEVTSLGSHAISNVSGDVYVGEGAKISAGQYYVETTAEDHLDADARGKAITLVTGDVTVVGGWKPGEKAVLTARDSVIDKIDGNVNVANADLVISNKASEGRKVVEEDSENPGTFVEVDPVKAEIAFISNVGEDVKAWNTNFTVVNEDVMGDMLQISLIDTVAGNVELYNVSGKVNDDAIKDVTGKVTVWGSNIESTDGDGIDDAGSVDVAYSTIKAKDVGISDVNGAVSLKYSTVIADIGIENVAEDPNFADVTVEGSTITAQSLGINDVDGNLNLKWSNVTAEKGTAIQQIAKNVKIESSNISAKSIGVYDVDGNLTMNWSNVTTEVGSAIYGVSNGVNVMGSTIDAGAVGVGSVAGAVNVMGSSITAGDSAIRLVEDGDVNVTWSNINAAADGVVDVRGNVNVNFSTVEAGCYGIENVTGNVTLKQATITVNEDGNSAIDDVSGNVTLFKSDVKGYENAISNVGQDVYVGWSTLEAGDNGIASVNGDVTVIGSKIDAGALGIYDVEGSLTLKWSTIDADLSGIYKVHEGANIVGSTITAGAAGVCEVLGDVNVFGSTINAGDSAIRTVGGDGSVNVAWSKLNAAADGIVNVDKDINVSFSTIDAGNYGINRARRDVNLNQVTITADDFSGVYDIDGNVTVFGGSIDAGLDGIDKVDNNVWLNGTNVEAGEAAVHEVGKDVYVGWSTLKAGERGVFDVDGNVTVQFSTILADEKDGIKDVDGNVNVLNSFIKAGEDGIDDVDGNVAVQFSTIIAEEGNGIKKVDGDVKVLNSFITAGDNGIDDVRGNLVVMNTNIWTGGDGIVDGEKTDADFAVIGDTNILARKDAIDLANRKNVTIYNTKADSVQGSVIKLDNVDRATVFVDENNNVFRAGGAAIVADNGSHLVIVPEFTGFEVDEETGEFVKDADDHFVPTYAVDELTIKVRDNGDVDRNAGIVSGAGSVVATQLDTHIEMGKSDKAAGLVSENGGMIVLNNFDITTKGEIKDFAALCAEGYGESGIIKLGEGVVKVNDGLVDKLTIVKAENEGVITMEDLKVFSVAKDAEGNDVETQNLIKGNKSAVVFEAKDGGIIDVGLDGLNRHTDLVVEAGKFAAAVKAKGDGSKVFLDMNKADLNVSADKFAAGVIVGGAVSGDAADVYLRNLDDITVTGAGRAVAFKGDGYGNINVEGKIDNIKVAGDEEAYGIDLDDHSTMASWIANAHENDYLPTPVKVKKIDVTSKNGTAYGVSLDDRSVAFLDVPTITVKAESYGTDAADDGNAYGVYVENESDAIIGGLNKISVTNNANDYDDIENPQYGYAAAIRAVDGGDFFAQVGNRKGLILEVNTPQSYGIGIHASYGAIVGGAETYLSKWTADISQEEFNALYPELKEGNLFEQVEGNRYVAVLNEDEYFDLRDSFDYNEDIQNKVEEIFEGSNPVLVPSYEALKVNKITVEGNKVVGVAAEYVAEVNLTGVKSVDVIGSGEFAMAQGLVATEDAELNIEAARHATISAKVEGGDVSYGYALAIGAANDGEITLNNTRVDVLASAQAHNYNDGAIAVAAYVGGEVELKADEVKATVTGIGDAGFDSKATAVDAQYGGEIILDAKKIIATNDCGYAYGVSAQGAYANLTGVKSIKAEGYGPAAGIYAYNGAMVTADVARIYAESEYGYAYGVDAEDAYVDITGVKSIKAEGSWAAEGIYAKDSTVTADVTRIYAESSNGAAYGVDAVGESTVYLTGVKSIKAEGYGAAEGIYAESGAEVTGDVAHIYAESDNDYADGICAYGSDVTLTGVNSVYAKGNVESNGGASVDGICLYDGSLAKVTMERKGFSKPSIYAENISGDAYGIEAAYGSTLSLNEAHSVVAKAGGDAYGIEAFVRSQVVGLEVPETEPTRYNAAKIARIYAESSNGAAYGIDAVGESTVSLTDVKSIRAKADGAAIGIAAYDFQYEEEGVEEVSFGGSEVTADVARIYAESGNGDAYGISAAGGSTVSLTDVKKISATGKTGAYGIYNDGSTVNVTFNGSLLSANGSGDVVAVETINGGKTTITDTQDGMVISAINDGTGDAILVNTAGGASDKKNSVSLGTAGKKAVAVVSANNGDEILLNADAGSYTDLTLNGVDVKGKWNEEEQAFSDTVANVVVGSGANVTMNLNDSSFKGAVTGAGDTTMSLDNASVWNVTGSSNLGTGNLTNNGFVNMSADEEFGTKLQINKLAGQGNIAMDIDVDKDATGTDTIGLGSVDPEAKVNVRPNFKNENLTDGSSVVLFTGAGAGALDGKVTFNGVEDIDYGAFNYSPVVGTDENGNAVLTMTNNKIGDDPVLSAKGNAALSAIVDVEAWYMDTEALYDNMDEYNAFRPEQQVWAKYTNKKNTYDDSFQGVASNGDIDKKYSGVVVGWDNRVKHYEKTNADLYVGAMLSYGDGKYNWTGGSNEIDGKGIGLYGVYKTVKGAYVSAVMKYNKYSLEEIKGVQYGTGDDFNGDYDSNAFGLSVAAGRRFAKDLQQGFYYEPQVELGWVKYGNGSYDLDGLNIDVNSMTSFRGRLGIQAGTHKVGKKGDFSDVYAKLSLNNEFCGSNDVDMGKFASFESDQGGAWVNFAIGGRVGNMNKFNADLNMNVSRGSHDSNVGFKIGLNWMF